MAGQLTDQANDLLTLRRAAEKLRTAQQDYEGELLKVKAGRGDRAIAQEQERRDAEAEARGQESEPLDISSMFPEQPVNMQRPSAGIPSAALAQVAQALGAGATASGGRGVQQVAGQQLPVAGSVIPEVQARQSMGSQTIQDQFGGFTTVSKPESQVGVNLRPNQLTARDLVTLERIQRADTRAQARLSLDQEKQNEALIDDYAGGLGSLIYEIEQARTPKQKIKLLEQKAAVEQHIATKYGPDVAGRALGRAEVKSFEIGREVDKEVSMELLRQRSQENIQGLLTKMREAATKGDKEGESFFRNKLVKETTALGYQIGADGTITPIAAGMPKSFSTVARIQSRHNTTQMALTIAKTLAKAIAEDPDLSGVAGSILRAGAVASGALEGLDSLTGGQASNYIKSMKSLLYDSLAAGDLPGAVQDQIINDISRLEDPRIAGVQALEILLPYSMVEVFRSDRPNESNIKAYGKLGQITGLGGELAPARLATIIQLLERTEKFTREQLITQGGKVIEQTTEALDLTMPGAAPKPIPRTSQMFIQPDGSYIVINPDGSETILKGKGK